MSKKVISINAYTQDDAYTLVTAYKLKSSIQESEEWLRQVEKNPPIINSGTGDQPLYDSSTIERVREMFHNMVSCYEEF